VVSLAIARSLALSGRELVLLEREAEHGSATSSRHSEVIHAGIYYPQGSLMARLCVEGKGRLYEYCAQQQVPHKRFGKLIVATSAQQVPRLSTLQARAAANGVTDLQLVTGAAASAVAGPGLRAAAALHSLSTGILDSHAYMACLLADFQGACGVLAMRARGRRPPRNTQHAKSQQLDQCLLLGQC
ncbi:hypothetical protein FOA52_008293, partial [Chlamydomonas sp. UWO 241]